MTIRILTLAQLAILVVLGCSDKKASSTAGSASIAAAPEHVPVAVDPLVVTQEPAPEVPAPKVEEPVLERAPATVIELAALPYWANRSPKATYILHAADADTHLLALAAADKHARLLGPSSASKLASGRIEVKSANAMWKGVHSSALGVSALKLKSRKGRGRKVDLSFWQADANDLMRLFADVLGTNVIMPRAHQKMTVQLRGVPVDEVQGALINSLGWQQTRQGQTTFVTPGPLVVDAKFQGDNKVKLDLDVNEAKASGVLGLLSAVIENKWTGACDAGKAISLRLRRESIGTTAAALTLLSGETLSQTGETCVEEATAIPSDKDKLAALATIGVNSVALFERGSGEKAVVIRNGRSYEGKEARVGRGFVAFGSADDGSQRHLHPSDVVEESLSDIDSLYRTYLEELIDLLRRSRLAATVVRPKSQVAIFEMPSGQFFMMQIGEFGLGNLSVQGEVGIAPLPTGSPHIPHPPFEIEPGKLLIKTEKPGQPPQAESIVLSRRP